MIRVAIVVQRYGREVVGGAETLARDVAERLNGSGYDITVFTTTALDYITWRNHYSPGTSILKGVEIRRFNVERERDIHQFNRFSETFFSEKRDLDSEKEWIDLQGPFSPALKEAVERSTEEFDLYIFFTYLYYSTVRIIGTVRKPVILFPTAHDESPFKLGIMKKVFGCPDSLFFLTGAEKSLVERWYHPEGRMNLIRTGVDVNDHIDERLFRMRFGVVAPFILYAGRIERGKGLEILFDAYRDIRKRSVINLVLMGKKFMDIPDIEGIRYVGFVSEEEKLSAFKGALFSIQPSHFESLSITTLESFTQKTAVLVNRESDVLMEHIRLSGGGESYLGKDELIEKFGLLARNSRLRMDMGLKGYEYVNDYFSWEKVLEGIDRELKRLTG